MAASVAMAAISTPKTSTAWHPVAPGGWWHLVAGGTWWLVADLRDASHLECEVPTSLTSPVRVAFQVLAQSDIVTNVLQNAHPVLICSNF